MDPHGCICADRGAACGEGESDSGGTGSSELNGNLPRPGRRAGTGSGNGGCAGGKRSGHTLSGSGIFRFFLILPPVTWWVAPLAMSNRHCKKRMPVDF